MGGTLKLTSSSDAAGTDRSRRSTTPRRTGRFFYITNDGLVEFNHTAMKRPPRATMSSPISRPRFRKPEDGGKTYVFTLRKGIKFSTGKPK